MNFNEQVVVVTGGGKGLGEEIAKAFASEGAKVAITGRNLDPLMRVQSEIEKQGGTCLAVKMDIGNQASVEEGASTILEEFGGVDVLINNAAIGGPSAPLWELDPEEWRETMDINVNGAFFCCRSFIPSMIERNKGSIVLIGSMSGKRPLPNRTAYTTSKIALVGMARTLAWEVGSYGIRVNVVSPGPMEGERLKWVFESQAEQEGISVEAARSRMASSSPFGRFVNQKDVVDMTLFLASDRSGSTTGEDINVSSGIAMY